MRVPLSAGGKRAKDTSTRLTVTRPRPERSDQSPSEPATNAAAAGEQARDRLAPLGQQRLGVAPGPADLPNPAHEIGHPDCERQKQK